jgi:hypothetical protein
LYLIELPLFLIACGGFYSNLPAGARRRKQSQFRPRGRAGLRELRAEHARNCSAEQPRLYGRTPEAPRHLALLAGLLGCALLSFSASHIIYIRAIFQEHG